MFTDPRERVKAQRLKDAKIAKKSSKTTIENLSDVYNPEDVDSAVEKYFKQVANMDMVEELKAQLQRKSVHDQSGESEVDWVKVNDRDILYISSLFDLSEWWDKVGRQAYQLIFPAVPLVIPVPSSNGYQERVFSACTYFDGDLKQRLKDTRYEMKVLTAVNEQLVDDLSPIDPVVHWAAPPNDEYSDLYANDEDSDLNV